MWTARPYPEFLLHGDRNHTEKESQNMGSFCYLCDATLSSGRRA